MADYYLSPSGNDGNSGTIGSPWFTLNQAWGSISAGDTVYMRGGTYNYVSQQDCTGVSGSSGNPITIRNYQDEVPVLTQDNTYPSGGQDLIIFAGDYFDWIGLEISTCDETSSDWAAFRSEGCNNCNFERINYHHNQLGFTIRDCNNNTFLNCDFHHNQDAAGDNADGLNITYVATTSDTNYVTNCRAWNNSDDGFDYWSNAGTVITTGCWAFHNGYEQDETTPAGDGSGFKLGELGAGATSSMRRRFINCVAAKNLNWGFNENNTPARLELFNCSVYDSGDGDSSGTDDGNYLLGWWSGTNPLVLTNCLNYVDGYNLASSDLTETTNSWQGGISVSDGDFESVDWTELETARQADGSLPEIDFLHLAAGSDLIDAGTDIGYGDDIGAFQYSAGGGGGEPVIITGVRNWRRILGIIANSKTNGGGGGGGLVDIDFTNLDNIHEAVANQWSLVSTSSDGNADGTVSLPASTDGQFQCEFDDSGPDCSQAVLCWDTSSSLSTPYYSNCDYGVFVLATYWYFDGAGNLNDSGITANVGDLFRLTRTGSTIKAQYFRGGSWTDIVTFTATTTAELFYFISIANDGGSDFTILNPKQENAT